MRAPALFCTLLLVASLVFADPEAAVTPHPHAGDSSPPKAVSVEEQEEKESNAAMVEARTSQNEVDRVTEEMMRKLTELEIEYHKQKMPLFQKRNEILKKVKGFWQRVVENHPGHGAWLRGTDKEILRYLVDVDVTEMEVNKESHDGSSFADLHLLHNFRISFTFSPNEFFSNMVLWRDVRGHAHDDHLVVSGITWFEGRAPSDVSFFNFFEMPNVRNHAPRLESHIVAEIGHVFRYELWPNPFTYHDLSRYHELLHQTQEGAALYFAQEQPYDAVEDHEVHREHVEADPILPAEEYVPEEEQQQQQEVDVTAPATEAAAEPTAAAVVNEPAAEVVPQSNTNNNVATEEPTKQATGTADL